jgi:hypothetical protein
MAQRKHVRIVNNDSLDLLLRVPQEQRWLLRKVPAWAIELYAPGLGYWVAYGAPNEDEAKRIRRAILADHPEWKQKTIGTQYPGDS